MSEAAAVVDEKNEPHEAQNPWREHCLGAVRKFVMNAVVVDNQPITKEKPSKPQKAAKADEGMETADIDEHREIIETVEDEGDDNRFQDLNIRDISDAFANEEIACAFVLPNNDDTDDDAILKRIIAAGMLADILILDWHLRKDNSNFTREVLKKIAEKDVAEKGRMRLICIYTGQPLHDGILTQAKEPLIEGGLTFHDADGDAYSSFGDHHGLLILNKQDVSGEDLPNKLLEAMSKIANGLLPAFSMAAVAAIRRNIHHIIARFGSNLDAAFVANRLITNPPTDVAELLKELFLSECDTALGFENVLDNYFGESQITYWFDEHNQPKTEIELKAKKGEGKRKEDQQIKINRSMLNYLLKSGFSSEVLLEPDSVRVKFPEEKRDRISQALHGNEDKSKKGEGNLARFVTLKREAFGNTKISSPEWLPILSLGSILRQTITDDNFRYYYCLTPSCDTIRIADIEQSFVFLELEEVEKSINFLLKEENGLRRLFINPKAINVRTSVFKGDGKTGCVRARKENDNGKDPKFYFTAVNPTIDFLWIGEVRQNRAIRDMSELISNWLRLGVLDSEFLRLAGKGKFKI